MTRGYSYPEISESHLLPCWVGGCFLRQKALCECRKQVLKLNLSSLQALGFWVLCCWWSWRLQWLSDDQTCPMHITPVRTDPRATCPLYLRSNLLLDYSLRLCFCCIRAFCFRPFLMHVKLHHFVLLPQPCQYFTKLLPHSSIPILAFRLVAGLISSSGYLCNSTNCTYTAFDVHVQ